MSPFADHNTRADIRVVLNRLDDNIAKLPIPPRVDPFDASYVCLNTTFAPASFDFITWLVDAEMRRRRHGAPAPLKVAFWQGGGRDERAEVELRGGESRLIMVNMRPWIDNVFRPALKFIGAVEEPLAACGLHSVTFVPFPIVEAYRRGEEIPILASHSTASFPKGHITITLRESERQQQRNSNVEAWVKLARDLKAAGEAVVFIRDTAKAYKQLDDFIISPLAAIDLPTRMGLYENAKANLFVSNGPASLLLYTKVPWLMFITLEDRSDEPYIVNTVRFWEQNFGLTPPDCQYPWSTPQQRLVFKPDTYENLVEGWRGYKETLG